MRAITVAQLVLGALIAIILGGLAGWYFFVHRSIAINVAHDLARGFGTALIPQNPLGSALMNITGGSEETPTSTRSKAAPRAPRLWRVSGSPVAGFGFIGSSSRLMFVERATGNVLEADPETSSVERRANTLIPKVYDALVTATGTVVLRTLDEEGRIDSFSGTPRVSTSTQGGPSPLSGTHLQKDIMALAPWPRKQLAYLLPGIDGSSIVLSDWSGGKPKTLVRSPLRGWNIEPDALGGALIVTQKGEDDLPGYAFALRESGAMEPLLSNIAGLSAKARGDGALLYSTSAGGAVSLFVRASDSAAVAPLPIATVAEKCVWSSGSARVAYCAVPQSAPEGAFLRAWWGGTIRTSDSWHIVSASSATAERFFTSDSELRIDAERPALDTTDSYIAFRNRADQSLWLLRIAP